jgi:hypothetical protein
MEGNGIKRIRKQINKLNTDMNVNNKNYDELTDLFYTWLSINDLDEYAIVDPERAAAFGFYVAKNSDIRDIDQWDIRGYIQLQLNTNELFGTRK